MMVRISHKFAALLIVLVSLAVYRNSFGFPFHFDTLEGLVGDRHVEIFSNALHYGNIFRRIPYITFSLNYQIGGYDPLGWHLVNWGIHVLAALALYCLVLRLLTAPALKGRYAAVTKPAALTAALIFAVHPVQTQAVTYIYQRTTLLAVLFYLSALALYACFRAGRAFWAYPASVVVVFFSFFTKPLTATLPLMIVFYEIFFCAKEDGLKRRCMFAAPFVLMTAVIPLMFLYRYRADLGPGLFRKAYPVPSAMTDVAYWQYALTELNVFRTYLRLLVFPVNQAVDYGYPIVRSALEKPLWFSAALLSAVASAGAYLWRKYRLLSFGIFWFFFVLLPEFTHVRDPIFEHRLYLPMAGFSLFVAAAVWGYVTGAKARFILAFLLVSALGWTAYARNQVWKDGITLWRDVVRKRPENPRGYLNLASALDKAGRPEETVFLNQKVIELGPDVKRVMAYSNIGMVLIRKGEYEEGLRYCRLSENLSSAYERHFFLMGLAHEKLNQTEEAVRYFTKAMNSPVYNWQAANNLGSLLQRLGRDAEAEAAIVRGLELKPEAGILHFNLGLIREKAGKLSEAREAYRAALDYGHEEAVVRTRLDGLAQAE